MTGEPRSMVLFIGIFFTLIILGLAATLRPLCCTG